MKDILPGTQFGVKRDGRVVTPGPPARRSHRRLERRRRVVNRLGLLVFRSTFLPWLLGVLLTVGSLGYLVLFVQAFFFPGTERTVWTNPFLAITHMSELALLLWLLIKGVNVDRGQRAGESRAQ